MGIVQFLRGVAGSLAREGRGQGRGWLGPSLPSGGEVICSTSAANSGSWLSTNYKDIAKKLTALTAVESWHGFIVFFFFTACDWLGGPLCAFLGPIYSLHDVNSVLISRLFQSIARPDCALHLNPHWIRHLNSPFHYTSIDSSWQQSSSSSRSRPKSPHHSSISALQSLRPSQLIFPIIYPNSQV